MIHKGEVHVPKCPKCQRRCTSGLIVDEREKEAIALARDRAPAEALKSFHNTGKGSGLGVEDTINEAFVVADSLTPVQAERISRSVLWGLLKRYFAALRIPSAVRGSYVPNVCRLCEREAHPRKIENGRSVVDKARVRCACVCHDAQEYMERVEETIESGKVSESVKVGRWEDLKELAGIKTT